MQPYSPTSPSSLSLKDLISLYSTHLTTSDIGILNDPPYKLTISLDMLLPNSNCRAVRSPPRPQNPWILFRKDFEARYRKHSPTTPARKISSFASEAWKTGGRDVAKFFEVLAKVAAVRHQMIYPAYKFSPKKTSPKEREWVFKPDPRSASAQCEVMEEDDDRKVGEVSESMKLDAEKGIGVEERIDAEERIRIELEKVDELRVEYLQQESETSPEMEECKVGTAFSTDFLPTPQSDLLPAPVSDVTIMSPDPFHRFGSPDTTFDTTAYPQLLSNNDNYVLFINQDVSEICNSDLMNIDKFGFPFNRHGICVSNDMIDNGIDGVGDGVGSDVVDSGVNACDFTNEFVQYGLPNISALLYEQIEMEYFDFELYEQETSAIDSPLSCSLAQLSAPPPGVGSAYYGTRFCSEFHESEIAEKQQPQSQLDQYQLQQQQLEKQLDPQLDYFQQCLQSQSLSS
ncbi:3150_t:CDS:1 [Paraglomus brasilianum]|uniref:3150_t:CDS:1 n=1 Tax=Paraglomus brasilianum TaxID=144538 RepID=A0A9N8ZN79_9GLOM|nr:3150_t:CDS:1 [Paraglomus brasilianum]